MAHDWYVFGSMPRLPPSHFRRPNAAANQTDCLLGSTGRVAEQMGNLEHALSAYENALRHNSHSLPGLTQVAGIARIKENYGKVRALSPTLSLARLRISGG